MTSYVTSFRSLALSGSQIPQGSSSTRLEICNGWHQPLGGNLDICGDVGSNNCGPLLWALGEQGSVSPCNEWNTSIEEKLSV